MKFGINQIKKKIYEVLDPELNISIVDLGLIYDVKLNKGNKVDVVMTLTTVGCPLITMIENQIKENISSIGIDIKNINIKVVFDPPWTTDKMTKKGKQSLGIL